MVIIPDVHGRDFWKPVVEVHKNEEIVFLGDYVDPYSCLEGVVRCKGLTSLLEIIDFKKQNIANVTLLLGNHDISYVSSYLPKCRYDYDNEKAIRDIIQKNISLFRIAYEKIIAGKQYIFTHAGILPSWLQENEMVLGQLNPGNVVDALNRNFAAGNLYDALGNVSFYRGGYHEAGSCVWADINEHFDYVDNVNNIIYSDVYQVFGHTLQKSNCPIITPHFACLDCRKAFLLDDEGRLSAL